MRSTQASPHKEAAAVARSESLRTHPALSFLGHALATVLSHTLHTGGPSPCSTSLLPRGSRAPSPPGAQAAPASSSRSSNAGARSRAGENDVQPSEKDLSGGARCVVGCAQSACGRARKNSFQTKTSSRSGSLVPPPLFGPPHVAVACRRTLSQLSLLRFRSAETRPRFTGRKGDMCFGGLSPPPPPRDAGREKSHNEENKFVLVSGLRVGDHGNVFWTDRQDELGN